METGESSESVRSRVICAREKQLQRFAGKAGIFKNADMSAGDVEQLAQAEAGAMEHLRLSMELVFGEVGVDGGEGDGVEGEVPGGEPRVLPGVGVSIRWG